MTDQASSSIPTLCHLTWHATNVEHTKAFLEALLGWTFHDAGNNYFVFQPPSGAWVGLTRADLPLGGAGAFLPQIAVDSLQEAVARARELGDGIVESEGVISGVGLYADLRDPDGSRFSLIEFRPDPAEEPG